MSTEPAAAQPSEIFEGEKKLDLAGLEVDLVEFGPAHTTSDTVVHVPEDGVVFAGDLMFCNCHPVLGYWPMMNWINICDTLLGWDAEIFVPGHGPICGKDEVLRHRDYILFLEIEARKCFNDRLSVFDASCRIFERLGKYNSLLRGDILRNNVRILYSEFSGDQSKESFDKHSVERWKFREVIRGRAPGIHHNHIPDGN